MKTLVQTILILFTVFYACFAVNEEIDAKKAVKPSITTFYPLNAGQAKHLVDDSIPVSLSQVLVALLGTITTGHLAPILLPVLVKLVVSPMTVVMRSMAKGMLLLGVTFFILNSLSPMFFSYLSLFSGSPYLGRLGSIVSYIPEPIKEFFGHGIYELSDSALSYMHMNNPQCKQLLSCKVGQFMVTEYPLITSYLKKFGVTTLLESSPNNWSNNNTVTLVNAMMGIDNCSTTVYQCESFNSFEEYIYTASSQMTTALKTTKSVNVPINTTPVPVSNLLTTEFFSDQNKMQILNMLEKLNIIN